MVKSILVANRGEIALRIIRTLKEMGIRAIAVYSTADKDAPFLRLADEKVCIGPPEASKSYMDIPSIISAAEITGAEAIHPGYGFLSENPEFARIVEECGMIFIGPSPDTIALAGDKIRSRNVAKELGIPVPPAVEEVRSIKDLKKSLKEIGLPVILKASMGGGGRGMRVIHFEEEIEDAYEVAKKESLSAFGSDIVYAEKYFEKVKHIEVQILGDGNGNVIHLGTRECSVQRRYQKFIEEAPFLNETVRENIERDAVKFASYIKYRGVGTVEFIFIPPDKYYFIEMNARIQVEHPVTEEITGIDIVEEGIYACVEGSLRLKQEDVRFDGHSIEVRINAEDPETFTPSTGKITSLHLPGGKGIRVDSGIDVGTEISGWYDPLLMKIITKGKTRESAIKKCLRALEELSIEGVNTNIPLLKKIITSEEFLRGEITVDFVEKFVS